MPGGMQIGVRSRREAGSLNLFPKPAPVSQTGCCQKALVPNFIPNSYHLRGVVLAAERSRASIAGLGAWVSWSTRLHRGIRRAKREN